MVRISHQERQRKVRHKLSQTVRVRPSDAQRHDFDEILPTINASRDSVYFASQNDSYAEGMRLFVTYPYSTTPGSINRDFLGRVVRIDELGRGRRGIAVEILMPIHTDSGETRR